MGPGSPIFRRWRKACLAVGIIGGGQTQIAQTVSACLNHPVECGKVIATLNGMLCGTQNDSIRIGLERVQPESLHLLDLFGI